MKSPLPPALGLGPVGCGWATKLRLTTIEAGADSLTAYAYDAGGRLVKTVSGTGSLAVPVEPFGFTHLLGD